MKAEKIKAKSSAKIMYHDLASLVFCLIFMLINQNSSIRAQNLLRSKVPPKNLLIFFLAEKLQFLRKRGLLKIFLSSFIHS